ncbi:hypothetical protein P3342_011837 [Pyrenophora teres f. teres]|nr:hypothetical protein P3342_011837 [Pyrenophora teres f. teres]
MHLMDVAASDNEGCPSNQYLSSVKAMYSRWMRDHDRIIGKQVEDAKEAARLRAQLSMGVVAKFEPIYKPDGNVNFGKMHDILKLQNINIVILTSVKSTTLPRDPSTGWANSSSK